MSVSSASADVMTVERACRVCRGPTGGWSRRTCEGCKARVAVEYRKCPCCRKSKPSGAFNPDFLRCRACLKAAKPLKERWCYGCKAHLALGSFEPWSRRFCQDCSREVKTGHKRCNGCAVIKPTSDFKKGLKLCKPCYRVLCWEKLPPKQCRVCARLRPRTLYRQIGKGRGGVCVDCVGLDIKGLLAGYASQWCYSCKEYADHTVAVPGRTYSACGECAQHIRAGLVRCGPCSKWLPSSEFSKAKTACRRCLSIAHRENKYGMPKGTLIPLYEAHGGKCAGCMLPLVLCIGGAGDVVACVDHNHVTGAVRGILCPDCNTSLGRLKDSPETLSRLARYLTGT